MYYIRILGTLAIVMERGSLIRGDTQLVKKKVHCIAGSVTLMEENKRCSIMKRDGEQALTPPKIYVAARTEPLHTSKGTSDLLCGETLCGRNKNTALISER